MKTNENISEVREKLIDRFHIELTYTEMIFYLLYVIQVMINGETLLWFCLDVAYPLVVVGVFKYIMQKNN